MGTTGEATGLAVGDGEGEGLDFGVGTESSGHGVNNVSVVTKVYTPF